MLTQTLKGLSGSNRMQTGRASVQLLILNVSGRLTYPHFSSNSDKAANSPFRVCSRSSQLRQNPHLLVSRVSLPPRITAPRPTGFSLARHSRLSLSSLPQAFPSPCFLNKALLNLTHLQFTALGITQIAHQSSL